MSFKNRKINEVTAETTYDEQAVWNDIADVYKRAASIMLTGNNVANIRDNKKREDKINKAWGIGSAAAKCLLNIFSCGLASSIVEGVKDIVGVVKKDHTSIETLSKNYDKSVKKYNKKKKKGAEREKTIDEQLEDVRKKHNIYNKNKFKEMVDSAVEYYRDIIDEKIINELEKQGIRIDKLEKENTELKQCLEELRKDFENLKEEQEQQKKQMQMLQAILKGSQSKGKINQTQLTSQRANIEATQVQQQTVIPGPEEDSDIGNDKTSDRKQQQAQTPLVSQSLDSGIAQLQDENKRVRGANKEMNGRKLELSSRSMPC